MIKRKDILFPFKNVLYGLKMGFQKKLIKSLCSMAIVDIFKNIYITIKFYYRITQLLKSDILQSYSEC